jgi:hypothetical protein
MGDGAAVGHRHEGRQTGGGAGEHQLLPVTTEIGEVRLIGQRDRRTTPRFFSWDKQRRSILEHDRSPGFAAGENERGGFTGESPASGLGKSFGNKFQQAARAEDPKMDAVLTDLDVKGRTPEAKLAAKFETGGIYFV